MIGQMKKYKESLKNMPDPVLLSQIPRRIDLQGLMAYAHKKGKKVIELSEQEKLPFYK